MQVELYADNWMMTMGIVGFKRILKDKVKETDFGVIFDTDVLKRVPEAFFDYMINEYDIAERDYNRMKNNLKYATNKEYFKQNLKEIKNSISNQLKKVEKYFPKDKETNKINEIFKNIKEIDNYNQIKLLEEQIDNYYNIMKTKKINEKLTINFIKTTIMGPFFGQPSFLNVSKNKLSKKEQIDEFNKSYIKPVLLDTQLKELLENNSEIDIIKRYLDENDDYKPFKDLKRKLKKKENNINIKEYIEKELPNCTFIDNFFATSNFEEMTFSPLGVSRKEALNFNWNLQKDQPIPLSSLAKLILFLSPAGVVFYNRKDGYGNQGEYRSYAGFVMSDDSFSEIYRKNNSYKIKKKDGNPFDEVVYDLLQDTKERSEKVINQLFFIELFSDYQKKKTLLDYYHMPWYIAKYFKTYGESLRYIHIREYREAFTRSALKGIEPKEEIFRFLRQVIKQSHSGVGAYIAARELNRIQCLKKGVGNMEKEDKKVYVVFKQGQEIRNILLSERDKRANNVEAQYTASGAKKINSIAYRLLNSSKAGNKKAFMDTLFRIHMTAEKEVSQLFLNILHEKELKFETVASAFIAGLLSPDKQYKQFINKEVKENE